MQEICTPWDEMMVKVDEAEKFTKFALCRRLWKVPDDLNLSLQRYYRLAVNIVSKEFQMIDAKYALSWIDDNAVFIEALQHSSQMVLVFLWVRASD